MERVSRPRALIVDSSLTVRMELRSLLSEVGFIVTACDTRASAELAMTVRAYALFLIDALLPDGTGFDLLRAIKARPKHSGAPAIMLSTEAEVREASGTPQEFRAAAIAAGAFAVVIKSSEIDRVKVLVRSILRCKRAAHGEDSGAQGGPSSRVAWRNQDEVPVGSLLYHVVVRSGLSSIIGPATIARACERAGVHARTMTASELQRALPAIRETLALFLPPEEGERRIAAIASLAEQKDGAQGPMSR